MFPPKERMCHKTGFKTSCHKLVTTGKCGRWGKLSLEGKNGTPEDSYMCLDDMQTALQLHTVRALNRVIDSIDAGRIEAGEQHSAALSNVAAALSKSLPAQPAAPQLEKSGESAEPKKLTYNPSAE